MNKYRNIKTTVDNIKFDSKKEAHRYIELKWLLEIGQIYDLKLQPRFELQTSYKRNSKVIRKIEYVADFSYFNDNGDYIVEDTKGIETDVFKIKKKLFGYKYPDIDLRII